ncbi:hypothetical protein DFH28DRAFT_924082 [Melampsora americana]|nr:hypothetical protein DFH28DRAFT_924082 [Melampsora americana]
MIQESSLTIDMFSTHYPLSVETKWTIRPSGPLPPWTEQSWRVDELSRGTCSGGTERKHSNHVAVMEMQAVLKTTGPFELQLSQAKTDENRIPEHVFRTIQGQGSLPPGVIIYLLLACQGSQDQAFQSLSPNPSLQGMNGLGTACNPGVSQSLTLCYGGDTDRLSSASQRTPLADPKTLTLVACLAKIDRPMSNCYHLVEGLPQVESGLAPPIGLIMKESIINPIRTPICVL